MANNYNDILTLVNAGNQMGLSNTIKRDYGIPLDFTSVQESYDAAIEYAATSTLAYVGQTVAVGAKLYIISDIANGTHTIGEGDGAVTYDNYLAEVGSKTEGDGNTIELDGQTLKLAGLTGLDNSKTYVPSLVNGKLVWAEPSATTVEGLDTRLQAVEGKVTAVEGILNGTEETDGLVDKVADNAQAIADETAAREAAIGAPADGETPASGVYGAFAAADADILAKIGTVGDNTTVVAMIAAAEQAAKDYADANDADTIYDDTALANRVTAVENAINDETTGLTKKVADNAAAISAETTRATEAEAQVLADAKTYTDAEIDGLSVAIEQKESVDYIVLKDKEGVEIASVNASKFVQDSFLNDVSYNAETKTIDFVWSMGDGSTKTDSVAVADFVQVYTAGNGLTLTGNEFAVDTTKIATVEALNAVSAVAEAATTVDEVNAQIDAKITAANLGQYAKASDVETALAGKVDNSTYTTDKATFAIKSEVETALGTKVSADTYATDKAALQTAIDGKVSKVSSEFEGEQVEWTLLSPENQAKLAALVIGEEGDIEVSGTVNAENVDGLGAWITTNRGTVAGLVSEADKTKLDGIEAGAEVNVIETVKVNGTALTVDADRAVNVTVPTKFTDLTDDSGFDARITAAKSAADAAASAVATLEAGQVTTNKTDIATLNTQLTATNNNVTNVTGRVATLETAVNTTLAGEIDAVEASVETLSGTVGGHTTEIATLKNTTIPAIQGEVDALETKFNDYSTTAQMNSAIADAIAGVDAGKLAEDIAANKTAIEAEVTRATGIEAGLRIDVDANAAAIKTLNGYVDAENVGDTGKSARVIAREEIAAQLAEAPEAFDTLIEMAEWLDTHSADAVEMDNRIATNEAILAGFGTAEGEIATVKGYVDAQIAAIPEYELAVATTEALGGVKSSEAENKVTVAADGVMEVNSVNVNKLTQTTGDVLILNGGNAAG